MNNSFKAFLASTIKLYIKIKRIDVDLENG